MRRLGELHDPEWGGFGARAPKFPPASALELLLRRGEAELAVPTLDGMAAGGMYDLVGGGFHRYSVDERWLVPHFEKMLYDNALLVPVYLHGWLVTGRERYREVVEETVEYLLRDLRLPGGGFASSQDADTDGVEGLTYTWAPGEGAPEELLEPFEDGRFDPARLARPGDAGPAAGDPRRPPAAAVSTTRRSPPGTGSRWRRWPRPGGGWSGPTGSTRRARWPSSCSGRCRTAVGSSAASARARRAARASSTTTPTSRTGSTSCTSRRASCAGSRSLGGWRGSRSSCSATTSTAASSSRRPRASSSSRGARSSTTTRFRPGTRCSPTCCCGWRGSTATTSSSGARSACCGSFGDSLGRGPTEFAWALNALDLYLATPRELAIVGPPGSDVARAALEPFEPNAVVAFGPAEGVPLLEGKELVDGKPAVYVCERFACQAPVTEAAAL